MRLHFRLLTLRFLKKTSWLSLIWIACLPARDLWSMRARIRIGVDFLLAKNNLHFYLLYKKFCFIDLNNTPFVFIYRMQIMWFSIEEQSPLWESKIRNYKVVFTILMLLLLSLKTYLRFLSVLRPLKYPLASDTNYRLAMIVSSSTFCEEIRYLNKTLGRFPRKTERGAVSLFMKHNLNI